MKKKILIVDDHNEFRRILRKFLESQNLNYLTFEASSERSAVWKARMEQPDIVLLEFQLPKMNGIKTSRLIKNVSPNSKIIVVSTFDTEKFQRKFIGEHVDGFIGKSEFDRNLVRILRKHLRNRSVTKQ